MLNLDAFKPLFSQLNNFNAQGKGLFKSYIPLRLHNEKKLVGLKIHHLHMEEGEEDEVENNSCAGSVTEYFSVEQAIQSASFGDCVKA